MTQAWDFVTADLLWGDNRLFLQRRVETIDWPGWGAPMRICNALRNAGIGTVADLVERTERDIRLTPNLGLRSLGAIKQTLALHALYLRQDGPV